MGSIISIQLCCWNTREAIKDTSLTKQADARFGLGGEPCIPNLAAYLTGWKNGGLEFVLFMSCFHHLIT